MFGTSPFIPMVLALGPGLALCAVLTFPKLQKEREKTTFGDHILLFGTHIALKIFVIVMLAEIYFTVFPELYLSPSEKSDLMISEVINSRILSLWMLVISETCLLVASVNVVYKKSKGLVWLALFAISDYIGWLAVNTFLDYVSS